MSCPLSLRKSWDRHVYSCFAEAKNRDEMGKVVLVIIPLKWLPLCKPGSYGPQYSSPFTIIFCPPSCSKVAFLRSLLGQVIDWEKSIIFLNHYSPLPPWHHSKHTNVLTGANRLAMNHWDHTQVNQQLWTQVETQWVVSWVLVGWDNWNQMFQESVRSPRKSLRPGDQQQGLGLSSLYWVT